MNLKVVADAVLSDRHRKFDVFEPSNEKEQMLTLDFHYHDGKVTGLEILINPLFSKTVRYKYIATETAVFNLVKTALNQLSRCQRFLAPSASEYVSWIKKKMWKDGHMTADSNYYVREQFRKGMTRQLAIHDGQYAIRDLCSELRTEGTVYLTVTDLLEGEINAKS